MVENQVSHPYKTIGICVYIILIKTLMRKCAGATVNLFDLKEGGSSGRERREAFHIYLRSLHFEEEKSSGAVD
jgi:hypothetical protein